MNKQTQKELLSIVKRNYEDVAEEFNETRKKKIWPEIVKLTEGVKDGDKILDVGCGNGRLLEALGGRKISYLGIDNCESLIEKARERFGGMEWEFKVGDISKLGDVPEFGFDYVFCFAVLHHIPGRDLRVSALRQLKNKIKDGGKIILSVWNLWPQKRFRKEILRFFLLRILRKNRMDFGDIIFYWKKQDGRTSKRYYHAFTLRELKIQAREAGLNLEKIYKDKYNYYLVLRK